MAGPLRPVTAGNFVWKSRAIRFAVSICNCLACQRRTGSAFGMQAGFKADQVQVAGRFSDFARISDEADRKEHVFHFCPDCGSQVFYTEPTEPDLIVVSVGSFADPSFPPPTESGYDSRRHHWVELPDSIQRYAARAVGPGATALRRRQVRGGGGQGPRAHRGPPRQGYLYYNVACCESLAGRTADAIEHLRQAIEHVGGLSRHGEAGLRLRSDPDRARFRGPDRPLSMHEPDVTGARWPARRAGHDFRAPLGQSRRSVEMPVPALQDAARRVVRRLAAAELGRRLRIQTNCGQLEGRSRRAGLIAFLEARPGA